MPRWGLELDSTPMLRLGQHIRLTRTEAARLARITGFAPEGIRTLCEFEAYVERCKAHYLGRSEDTRLMHRLIDDVVKRCRQSA